MPERNQHEPAGFNAEQLFEYLSKFSPAERQGMEVYIRVAPEGSPLNIKTLDYVQESTYSFFGHPVPCLVLNDERFAPAAPDEEAEETAQ